MKMSDMRAKARAIFGPAFAEPMPNQPNGAKALQQRANARPIPTYKVGGPVKKPMPTPADLAAAKAQNEMIKKATVSKKDAAAIAAGREIMSDALFIEAPLPPPHFPAWFKLPPKYWGAVARFWWHVFNHHEGQESRAEAEARSEAAARALIARAQSGQDVLVLAHGYFNHMVGRRLRADGWSLVHNQGFKYWSQRRYESR